MQNYFDNEATSSALHATMKPARGEKCLVTLSTYEVCSHKNNNNINFCSNNPNNNNSISNNIYLTNNIFVC